MTVLDRSITTITGFQILFHSLDWLSSVFQKTKTVSFFICTNCVVKISIDSKHVNFVVEHAVLVPLINPPPTRRLNCSCRYINENSRDAQWIVSMYIHAWWISILTMEKIEFGYNRDMSHRTDELVQNCVKKLVSRFKSTVIPEYIRYKFSQNIKLLQ